ncbi:MAG: hypothetical protein JWN70_6311 [Planctomycetaceae bacterium]|nr:hypothetical protein [Planctomycetaceae bacterium]
MKLRIKDNSVRVRLDRRDLDRLIELGRVESVVRFGPTSQCAFSYAVELRSVSNQHPTVDYYSGRLLLAIGREDANQWYNSELVGFEHEQTVDGGVVRVLLEKDFACVDRPAGEESDDAWAFPNPAAVCSSGAAIR